MTVYGAIVLF